LHLTLDLRSLERLAVVRLSWLDPANPVPDWRHFNAMVRLECLARHWFLDLDDVREKLKNGALSSMK
jgi:hypothetical protein